MQRNPTCPVYHLVGHTGSRSAAAAVVLCAEAGTTIEHLPGNFCRVPLADRGAASTAAGACRSISFDNASSAARLHLPSGRTWLPRRFRTGESAAVRVRLTPLIALQRTRSTFYRTRDHAVGQKCSPTRSTPARPCTKTEPVRAEHDGDPDAYRSPCPLGPA
jgi:hypothetical protein